LVCPTTRKLFRASAPANGLPRISDKHFKQDFLARNASIQDKS
jgi:hypothetical protein